jgi:nitroreductase
LRTGRADFGNFAVAASMGGSIFPAVQNLLLACRAKGLGATLTSLHLFFEDEVNALLQLPPGVRTFAMIPVGYPTGKFGPTKRLPVDDVIVWDRWKA